MADAQLIKAYNKISQRLDDLLPEDFVTRDDFSEVLAMADATSTHTVHGKEIAPELDYLWKSFERELDAFQRKGGSINEFNASFLVKKLRNFWAKLGDKLKQGDLTMEDKEKRMSSLIDVSRNELSEDKRYTPRAALDAVNGVYVALNGLSGNVSRAKVVAIDYDNASKAATIERLFKQLTEELFSLQELLTLEVEKEDKKIQKAEKDLDTAEEETGEELLEPEEGGGETGGEEIEFEEEEEV